MNYDVKSYQKTVFKLWSYNNSSKIYMGINKNMPELGIVRNE